MKKKKILIIVFLAILFFVLAYILIRLINPSIKAVIIQCSENNHLSVMDTKTESLYYVDIPENIDIQFKDGQEIIIYYNNNAIIEDSYPASISSKYVKSVNVLKEKSDIRNSSKIIRIVIQF